MSKLLSRLQATDAGQHLLLYVKPQSLRDRRVSRHRKQSLEMPVAQWIITILSAILSIEVFGVVAMMAIVQGSFEPKTAASVYAGVNPTSVP